MWILGLKGYLGEGAYYRVRTLSSSSNSMTFHDFSMNLNSSTDTNSGVHHNVCHLHSGLNYSSLSYIVIALSSAVTYLSNKTLIFSKLNFFQSPLLAT